MEKTPSKGPGFAKRNPQILALPVLAAAFVYYCLNLGRFSAVNGKIGDFAANLSEFAVPVLILAGFVLLLMICLPRKAADRRVRTLGIVMLAAAFCCDWLFIWRISEAVTRADITFKEDGITDVRNILKLHSLFLLIGIAAAALTEESVRKALVALKRKPQIIALAVLAAAFVYYSLNLTQVSNTTAKIYGSGMGLAEFATMLLSILSLVCFLNAFPHRKKTNIPMLVLMFLMIGIIIFCDFYYAGRIAEAVTRAENPISMEGPNSYIANAKSMLGVHRILLFIGAALTALLPVYSPLIRKINTSVEVAANEEMGTIDISGEDA